METENTAPCGRETVAVRPLSSIAELMKWREEVIVNVFGVVPDSRLLADNRRYYETHIPDGSHAAFVASVDDTDCGCGAICFSDELPSPDNPTGRCAYLMNIYVRHPFRHRGIAHSIVLRLVDEAKRRDCAKIYLETTADGRPVYESVGFKDMPDMMKYYDTKI